MVSLEEDIYFVNPKLHIYCECGNVVFVAKKTQRFFYSFHQNCLILLGIESLNMMFLRNIFNSIFFLAATDLGTSMSSKAICNVIHFLGSEIAMPFSKLKDLICKREM